MALTKEQKEKIVEGLKDKVARQKAMVLVGITGLKVKDISELRKRLKSANANLKVAKKTLIEKALKESNFGSQFDKESYKEEIGLVFGFEDEISPAKIAYLFSKENESLKILGGFFEGSFRQREEIIVLAQLPAKEELLAKMVGSLSAPISNLVYALNYNVKGLITVLAKAKTI